MNDSPPPNAIVSERRVRCTVDVAAATWLVQAGDLDGARRVLEAALSAVPHDVRGRALLGQVLFCKRDFVAASEIFERLLAEFPTDVPLHFNLALCHLKGGRPFRAAAAFRSILDARPDHARARAWLRVAEAATPAPPDVAFAPPAPEPAPAPPKRTSSRPALITEVPRVTLPPGTIVAKDESGVVSLRIDEGTRWVVRRTALQGYQGEVTQETAEHGDGFAELSGRGTALLQAPGSLVVLELQGDETGARATALAAYGSSLGSEIADPEVVGDFGEAIYRFSGTGTVVLEAHAELTALPVSLTHATTVRWDHVVGWTGHVIGAPSSRVGADGRKLARFAGNGSLLLAMQDDGPKAAVPGALESYGRYEVLRRLGGGPRDEVLLARSAGPGGFRRKVVLERRLVTGEEPRLLERLAREAHAYAIVTHPAIARLYDFLLLDGHPVVVREYVSGVSLPILVTALGVRDAAAREPVAMYLAHSVLSALAAAHDAREPDTGDLVPLVHGDVRPGSVLIGWNGDVKLAGFAAAREEDGKPLTMKSDVRAAARLLCDMLGPRSVGHAASEAEHRGALGRVPLVSIREDRRDALRELLLYALVPGIGGAPRARELADAIAEGLDLREARALCVDELGALRDSLGGPTPSSLPPPPIAGEGDSGFFQRLHLPKPSPVPRVPIDPGAPPPHLWVKPQPAEPLAAPQPPEARAEPPPVDVEDAPPTPLQPASLEPAVTSKHAPAPTPSIEPARRARERRVATAIAIAVIAASTGIASIDGTRTHGPIDRAAARASAPPPESSAGATSAEVPVLTRPAELPVLTRPAELPVLTRPAAPAVTAAPPTPGPAAPATPEASTPAPATATPGATPAAPDGGVLRAPERARQHRVYLDGRVIGEGPGDYVVPCGAHKVRVGSHGDEQPVEVPCGGTVEIE